MAIFRSKLLIRPAPPPPAEVLLLFLMIWNSSVTMSNLPNSNATSAVGSASTLSVRSGSTWMLAIPLHILTNAENVFAGILPTWKRGAAAVIDKSEGVFNKNGPGFEETVSIIILPDYDKLPSPSVELPEMVRLVGCANSMAEGAKRKEQLAFWTADKKLTSAYAMNLLQLESGVTKCDKTENLWLKMTDARILCGRKGLDGTAGHDHAIEHYKETDYPLALKLGTTTADIGAADVFSYPEDESVLDPLLWKHLAFSGFDFSSLQKTQMTTAEKEPNQSTNFLSFFGINNSSLQKNEMTTAQRELDRSSNFDRTRIQVNSQELKPLFGPGYTGLVNFCSSCCLAARIQVVFSTRSFCTRCCLKQDLKKASGSAPADAIADLKMQLTMEPS